LRWHGTFNDGYWFFATVKVECPGICREALCIFCIDSAAFGFDELALGGSFGGFLGWRLSWRLGGRLLGRDFLGRGGLLGHLAVFDG
jgi:hypothetical protein